MDKKIPLLVVSGPTASGKTATAVQIAERFNGEIISADSMQIYKKMNVGTAKPTAEEMHGVPHHLIDVLEPTQKCSVADYCKMAHDAVTDVYSRGKLPILAGGTGLYINSVVSDMDFSENERQNPELREELSRIYHEQGPKPLYERLKRLDAQEAETIDKRNGSRLIRAIEVCELYQTTMSEYKKRNVSGDSRYISYKIGLTFRNRSKLYEKIDSRVDEMVKNGLLGEAEEVLKIAGDTAVQAIGYKELKKYFDGEESLETAIERIKQQSRRYAKRQLTWFRRDENINWFYWDDEENFEITLKKIDNEVEKFLTVCYN